MTKKELGDLAWVKDPFIMFIAKTWTNEARLKKVKCSLKFDHMFLVPLIHKWGGGVVLHWKDSINLRVEASSKNHIDYIIEGGSEGAWRFIGFYGEPITHKRYESWSLLRQLKTQFNLPWLCLGNFKRY